MAWCLDFNWLAQSVWFCPGMVATSRYWTSRLAGFAPAFGSVRWQGSLRHSGPIRTKGLCMWFSLDD